MRSISRIAFNLRYIVFFMWILMSLLSINHLYSFSGFFVVSTSTLGVIGWFNILITLIYLSYNQLSQSVLIFIVFFCLGYSIGPYMEPPVDHFEHLKRSYSYCDVQSNALPKTNMGFWHYNMNGVFLCSSNDLGNADAYLRKIDIIHGMYWGIAAVVLFLLGKCSGLPDRWAITSLLIGFFFFGTNRFSYFSYYSLAPSYLSMMIFWLWIAVFFFHNSKNKSITGVILLVILFPIQWVNHQQETVFLGFVGFVWLGLNLHFFLWRIIQESFINSKRSAIKLAYTFFIVFVLFGLPQLDLFKDIVFRYFGQNEWNRNQRLIFYLGDFHIIGKIWANRIYDTLGVFGFFPWFVAPLLIIRKIYKKFDDQTVRISILGVLPAFVFLLPLFHFIWVVNIKKPIYWRFCYSSLFWLFCAFFLFKMEKYLKTALESLNKNNKKESVLGFLLNSCLRVYWVVSICVFFVFSCVRSSPVFGKLDFILLDSRPWWPEWKPMIENVLLEKKQHKMAITDPITGAVLKGVFNFPVIKFRERSRSIKSVVNVGSANSIINRQKKKRKNKRKYLCLLNLKGFTPSWVPVETRHWQFDLANTSFYYIYKGVKGDRLNQVLKDNPPIYCQVYFEDK